MRPALLIASADAERRHQLRSLLSEWPCYEASDLSTLRRQLAVAQPALLLLDGDWPAGGAERAGLIELRVPAPLLGLRERVAALLRAPPPTMQ